MLLFTSYGMQFFHWHFGLGHCCMSCLQFPTSLAAFWEIIPNLCFFIKSCSWDVSISLATRRLVFLCIYQWQYGSWLSNLITCSWHLVAWMFKEKWWHWQEYILHHTYGTFHKVCTHITFLVEIITLGGFSESFTFHGWYSSITYQ